MQSFVQGTLDFMSVEVELEKYLFVPRVNIVTDIKGRVTLPTTRVFRYNPLHDLESLWWVALWMILNHRDSRDEVAHSSADQQAGYARLFFPGSLRDAGRIEVLTIENTLCDALHVLPPSFQFIAVQLEAVRRCLVDQYKEAEANAEINPAAFQGIHALFLNYLANAKNNSQEVKLCLLDGSLTSKRSRGNSVATDLGTDSSRATSPTPKSKPKKAKH
jgi:hypothetical protein